MHGEILPMWLNDFKIAIVEQNIEKLNELMDSIPQLETKEEMTEALYLIKEASELVQNLKNETSNSMGQIRKNLHYLKSTQNQATSNLEIRY